MLVEADCDDGTIVSVIPSTFSVLYVLIYFPFLVHELVEVFLQFALVFLGLFECGATFNDERASLYEEAVRELRELETVQAAICFKVADYGVG